MSEPPPHTETETDSNLSLAVALIGIALIVGLFVAPWFFDDSWKMGYQQTRPIVVELKPRGLAKSPQPQQAYRDPPPYTFGVGAPDLSKLPTVTS